MEFEKLQKIIAEVLNLSEHLSKKISEQILLMYSRSSWESKKSLTLRSIMKKRRK